MAAFTDGINTSKPSVSLEMCEVPVVLKVSFGDCRPGFLGAGYLRILNTASLLLCFWLIVSGLREKWFIEEMNGRNIWRL